MKKPYLKKILIILLLAFISCNHDNDDNNNSNTTNNKTSEPSKIIVEFSLPLGGNVYSSVPFGESQSITNNGIEGWTNSEEYFTTYFRVDEPGVFEISIDNESVITFGKSILEFTINNQSTEVEFNETNQIPLKIGVWKIEKPGYIAIKIKGIYKTESLFPNISKLTIGSSITMNKIVYVPNNEDNFFHWGRRGPSVHLGYAIPLNVNTEWFYNEIIVPVGDDIIGSYYMANGFAEGYFGMQVNSATERRILFSVWSSFVTDNPNDIPESYKIKLLKKGEGVITGEFGNEGSGGQSYLKYNWIAGNKYKFLLRGTPQGNNTTTYTAYFFAPEVGKWQLIASFNRPETNTYLKSFHSFLENFQPNQGNKSRKVLFNNQWYCDDKGNWKEINTATFTIDGTGTAGYRMDYAGGLDNQSFYLKNGGFFNEYTTPNKRFTRPLTQDKPNINLNTLP